MFHAGIKFFQIGCNGVSAAVHVPPRFGGKARTARVSLQLHARLRLRPDSAEQLASRNYLRMVMTSDNEGPPSVAEVEHLRQQAAKAFAGRSRAFRHAG